MISKLFIIYSLYPNSKLVYIDEGHSSHDNRRIINQ